MQPFLRNLFSDPAILRLPSLLRGPLANFIARRRAPKAQDIYAKIGGSSPILGQTEAQARALEEALGTEHEWRGYVCMRYWHPMTEAVVRSVKRFAPDRIVLLPLYPQFSTTTTDSSVKAWKEAAAKAKLSVPTQTVCCYPDEDGFISASVELLRQGLRETGNLPSRVLFSAHGLPERVIKAGDPYQAQVERTAQAIADRIGGLDWSVCYQSRVGPLKWIGPSTDAEIARAGADSKAVVLYPLSLRVGALGNAGRTRHGVSPSRREERRTRPTCACRRWGRILPSSRALPIACAPSWPSHRSPFAMGRSRCPAAMSTPVVR